MVVEGEIEEENGRLKRRRKRRRRRRRRLLFVIQSQMRIRPTRIRRHTDPNHGCDECVA